jgi:membrane-associated phospholipid phosphatase
MNLTLSAILIAVPFAAAGQTTESGQTPPAVAQPPAPGDRPVSFRRLPSNLLSDQRRIWSFPVTLAHGQGWLPTVAVLGTTAGLVALDPTESAYFRRASAFQGFNGKFTSNATLAGILATPVSLLAAGLIRKDPEMQHTALLAGEALADAEIVASVLKEGTGRLRPSAIPLKGNFSDSWFEGQALFQGSFPSGHVIGAFSIATVVSRRYGKQHRWVPYTAYGLAALVGFSRLSLSSHFLSDVFMGGALGYSIGRFGVLRQ